MLIVLTFGIYLPFNYQQLSTIYHTNDILFNVIM